MSGGGLYEQVLARLGGEAARPAPAPPRSSASVVLWRRSAGAAVEVFWIRRSPELAFMGGWHAFPGGGLSKRDRELPVEGRPAGVGGGVAGGSADGAAMPPALLDGVAGLPPLLEPGLLACALRELFEETGVLLAPEVLDGRLPPARLEVARRRLLDREARFGELLAAEGLTLDAGPLVYAGRWLTPPLAPRRFDNRFFLLEWPAGRPVQPRVVPGEAESGEWVRPLEAVARWRRGELITAPPILHLLEVLGREGPEAGLSRLRWPEEANLGPFRRIEFRPGVLMFPLVTPTLPPATHTNAYVLGTGEAVLVDPGSPYEREIGWLREALEALPGRLGRRVGAIWLTHHHPDHVGGVEAMRRALGVQVLAHPAAAERLAAAGLRVDGELAGGERIVLGGEPPFPVRVLHTPGHARGHLSFFDETYGSLVAGDAVSGLSTIVVDPPEGDMDAYLGSLERLRELGPSTLFPAHGPPITAAAARLEEYLEHRLWREDRVLAAWRSGLREPAAMLATVYDDVPAVAHPLAERQIVAHLERLRARGRLDPGP